MNDFQKEWTVIHNDIEKYERFSLLIKLFAIFISVFSLAFSINTLFCTLLIMLLWLQEGIWKTFQSRLQIRILLLEHEIRAKTENPAFQLYSQWQNERLGIITLLKEYLSNSLKPTVAYPYIILIILLPCYQLIATL